MSFHVGQRVVCVNGTYKAPNWALVANKPRRGGIYTVRDVGLYDFTEEPQVPVLLLNEIVNPPLPWDGKPPREIPFAQCRFRPIEPRTTDISIFQKMLIDVPHEAEGVE